MNNIRPTTANDTIANTKFPTSGQDIHIIAGDLKTVVQSGTVANILISKPESGPSGVILFGHFVPAKLPSQLMDGQRVQVQLLSNRDELLLKIINLAPNFSNDSLSETLSQLFEKLLPELKLKDLRLAAPKLTGSLPLELLKKTTSNETSQSKDSHNTTTIDPKVAKIFEQLIKQDVILTDNKLGDPKEIQKFLRGFQTATFLKTITEAKQNLEKIATQNPAPQQVRLLETLQATISSLLDSDEPLNFESTSTPKTLALQLRLYLIASQSALETGNLKVIDNLNADMSALKKLANPLGLLAKVLLNIDFNAQEESVFLKATIKLTQELANQLLDYKSSNHTSKDIKALLQKAREEIGLLLNSKATEVSSTTSTMQVLNLVKQVEQLLQGQEQLNKVNPVMQGLGEPVFILFPALLSGFLSKWQMTFDPKYIDEQLENNSKNNKNKSNYRIIEMSTNFPHLGDIKIALAHKEKELLLNLTFNNDAAADFTKQTLEKLNTRFAELGFDKPQVAISANVNSKSDIYPSWYKELITKCVTA